MTDPRITDEAVEAAARSLYKSDAQGLWEYGDLTLLLAYRDVARAALEAALPHLTPTREQIEEALMQAAAHREGYVDFSWIEGASNDFADAVLALINGSAS